MTVKLLTDFLYYKPSKVHIDYKYSTQQCLQFTKNTLRTSRDLTVNEVYFRKTHWNTQRCRFAVLNFALCGCPFPSFHIIVLLKILLSPLPLDRFSYSSHLTSLSLSLERYNLVSVYISTVVVSFHVGFWWMIRFHYCVYFFLLVFIYLKQWKVHVAGRGPNPPLLLANHNNAEPFFALIVLMGSLV